MSDSNSINDIYGGGRYLKAADLKGRAHKLVISSAELVEFKERDGRAQNKIVLGFDGREKMLVVNATNARRLAQVTESEQWDQWKGHECVLIPDKTEMGGQLVDCIRVKLPEAGEAPAEDGDDIVF